MTVYFFLHGSSRWVLKKYTIALLYITDLPYLLLFYRQILLAYKTSTKEVKK